MLTDDAYAQLHAANKSLMAGCERVIAEYGLPAHTVGMGSKGCVVFSAEPVREYRDYLTKIHHDLSDLAWLYHMNNGIFMTPGQDEEWTLSVLHTDADLARYVEVFETFARDVTPRRSRAGTWLIACSAIAVMVRLGFTPTLAGTAAPSQTSRFS